MDSYGAQSSSVKTEKEDFLDALEPTVEMLDELKKQEESSSEETPKDEFAYNFHNESIFDDQAYFPHLKEDTDVVKFDPNNQDILNHATLRALIVQLTSPLVVDYALICDFFLTYRMFANSEKVLNLLLTRLIWALQYIRSGSEENVTLGKMVLLRTFVVLRHWILNYFSDDFAPNLGLCDLFIRTINIVTVDSVLVSKDRYYETKILLDLKTHWLSRQVDFWNLNISVEEIPNILEYKIPNYSELLQFKKNARDTKDMSVRTNPSYRRSAMLSLYDPSVHHKCLILDETMANEENPQLSVHKLLIQHQPSRESLNVKLERLKNTKLKGIDVNEGRKVSFRNRMKNHQMNLQDSSLGLKKTSKAPNKEYFSNSPFNHDQSPMNLSEPHENLVKAASGFSVNGQIKLPSSKVTQILPPTPVKKMEYVISTSNTSPHKANDKLDKHTGLKENDILRKSTIKKIMESWKKSGNDSDSSLNLMNGNLETDMIIDDINATTELEDVQDGPERADILTARTVDELEYLIRFYFQNDGRLMSPSIMEDNVENDIFVNVHDIDESFEEDQIKIKTIEDSPIKEAQGTDFKLNRSNTVETADRGYRSSLDLNDISELSFSKIDNLVNTQKLDGFNDRSHETLVDKKDDILTDPSFQKAASINWNDEARLNLECSELKSVNSTDDSNSGINNMKEMNMLDFVPEIGDHPPEPRFQLGNNSNSSVQSSFSTPSNITQYDAEVADLGIALSPQQMKHNSLRKINFQDSSFSNGSRISYPSRNSSRSVFQKDRDSKASFKSYISYDSAFSVSNGVLQESNEQNKTNSINLKKKKALNNIRAMAGIDNEDSSPTNRISIGSNISRSTSLRRSVRFSTIHCLVELPFNEVDSDIFEDNRRLSGRKHRSIITSDFSIFSSVARRDSAVKRNLNENDTVTTEDRSTNVNETVTNQHTNSSGSNAIPGISNHVLKELAAIPDESLRLNNPVEFALHKLEGKGDHKNKGKDNTHNNTEDILDAINNVHTEDVEDLSIMNDITQEKPLSPKTTSSPEKQSPIMSVSTPSNQYWSMNMANRGKIPSPKTILIGYKFTTDVLSIEQVMHTGSHMSFILSYDSKVLSNHFTLIEKDILQAVDWKDVIELNWEKELNPLNSWLDIMVNEDYFDRNKGVNIVIARFNLMVNWIISEILLTKRQEERINIISRLIHIAYNCYVMQNFSTTMQIVLALTSEKALALKETWKNLPPGEILILKNLEELASPFKNFLNIRLAINRVQPSKGCIPFLGVYLSDLIFNAERPTFMKISNSPNDTDTSAAGNSTLSSSNDQEKLINFAKFRTSVHIIKSLSQCIEWSTNYNLDINKDILSKCLYIKSLDEEEMNYCIETIKNQDV